MWTSPLIERCLKPQALGIHHDVNCSIRIQAFVFAWAKRAVTLITGFPVSQGGRVGVNTKGFQMAFFPARTARASDWDAPILPYVV